MNEREAGSLEVKHMLTANCKEIMKLSTMILLWLLIKNIERPRAKSWKGSKYGAFSKSWGLSPLFVKKIRQFMTLLPRATSIDLVYTSGRLSI